MGSTVKIRKNHDKTKPILSLFSSPAITIFSASCYYFLHELLLFSRRVVTIFPANCYYFPAHVLLKNFWNLCYNKKMRIFAAQSSSLRWVKEIEKRKPRCSTFLAVIIGIVCRTNRPQEQKCLVIIFYMTTFIAIDIESLLDIYIHCYLPMFFENANIRHCKQKTILFSLFSSRLRRGQLQQRWGRWRWFRVADSPAGCSPAVVARCRGCGRMRQIILKEGILKGKGWNNQVSCGRRRW
jgi:hypothetical protein